MKHDEIQSVNPIWRTVATDDQGRSAILVSDYDVPLFPVPVSSTAFRLRNGHFAVYSPGAQLVDSFDAGDVEYLIASNYLHHLGLKVWGKRFPQARKLAAPAALKRLRSKGHTDLECIMAEDEQSEDKNINRTDQAEWQKAAGAGESAIRLYAMPFIRSGDIIASIPYAGGRAWVVCDAFLNITETPRNPLKKLYYILTDEYPDLKVPRLIFPLVKRKNRAAYRNWCLDMLTHDQPTMLIPTHGTVLKTIAGESDLVERISSELQRVLGRY